jgi:aerobic carbon-monoxide dehydrogenase large subunit
MSRWRRPTPLNPLGAKGIGESGTIGATPAVHNAVCDALAPPRRRHIDMPCTPEKVWRAIRDAEPLRSAPLAGHLEARHRAGGRHVQRVELTP